MSDVEVALSPADSGAVACNASNGLVGIAILPNGGRGAHGGAPGTGGSGTGGAGAPGAGSSTTASPGTGSLVPGWRSAIGRDLAAGRRREVGVADRRKSLIHGADRCCC